MRNRFTSLAIGAMLVAGSAVPSLVLAAQTDEYTADPARAVFAVFEDRDGDNRSLTTVFATRGKLDETDGETFGDQAVLVWTSTWNKKKDKVRRVAFGAAEASKVKVNVDSSLDTGTVSGKVRVYDAVKDEEYTLELDLQWSKDGGKESLNLDETYEPAPSDEYSEDVFLKSSGTNAKDATANGDVTRGNTDLVNKKSAEAYIIDLSDGDFTIEYPD